MSSPRISVITATYNWSAVLRYAIESVLAQTFPDFEMLVVGDGCTDDSGDVVASFNDRRLHWHNLSENSGHQSAPNNAGLARARGEFVAYLGHDDLWTPHHLAELAAALEQSSADVAYSWTVLVFPPPSPLRVISGLNPSGKFEPGLSVPPSSLMHRRDLFATIGEWKDYRAIRVDPETDLLERAFAAGKKFVAVPSLSVFKFNSAFRPNSYVEKPSHEQAAYSQRMRAEPDFLVRELSAALQSHIVRHPEDVLRAADPGDNSLGTNVRRSRVLRGLDRPERVPLAEAPFVPAKILFDSAEAENFLGDGWAATETGFRWSDGARASLIFRLRELAPLRWRMALTPFLHGDQLTRQTVRVLLNGERVSEHLLSNAATTVLEAALPRGFLKLENCLTLDFPDAVSPAALGLSTDVRQLAIAVQWIEFLPNESSASPVH